MLIKKHFRHYYLKYILSFLLGIAILVVIDWYQLEIPRLLKVIIDGVENLSLTSFKDIWPTVLKIIIIAVAVTVGRFLWRILLIGTSRKIETDIRQEMFKHASKLDQSFYTKEKVGGLMTYFINDLSSVRELYGFGLLMIVDGLVLGIFVLIRMFQLDYKMTLYALIPIVLMAVVVFLLNQKMEKKFKLRQDAFEEMSHFAQESFSGIAVIKAYVREASEAFGFKKKSFDVYQKSMDYMHYFVIVNIIIESIINVIVIAIIAFGSLLIARGEMSSGELTEYVSYFFTLLWPVFAISWFLSINGQAQASATRIYEFLETKPIIFDQEDVLKDISLNGEITFKNLSFKYEGSDKLVLKKLNFKINAGEMVGIIGRTGSGKSTIVELLLHLHNVKKGMLYFDKIDQNKIALKTLRNHLGYVPQDNFLFSETIKENINFAFDEVDEEKTINVAKLADVHGDINEFKEGYETILGERGTTISGGQKQRLSIARALIKDPVILILDDAVSAVDMHTEEAIIKNLRKLRKGQTTIFIAHRISTVKNLDKIIVIDEGEIKAIGTHKELLKTSGLYKHLANLQKLEDMIGEEISYA
ncbi:MAG: ABC transporter ATP-binding protein [Bacilli bacterium]|jgi:ATP-binding cassette subfamily B protein|nr:ABC transporter ATP-binding protein [Bacilli bacterium]